MNILVESRAFYPSVGGLEMMSHALAVSWQDAGHAIRVITVTPLNGASELNELSVVRAPSQKMMQRHVRWADVFVQSGISLRSLHWPLLTGTPLAIIHHNLLSGGQDTGIRAWMKRRATHLGVNIAVSRPVVETVPGSVVRIPNTFRPVYDEPASDEAAREGLLFVGRLVSVKGADLAIEALERLHRRGIDQTLTICGDGPERKALEEQARRAGLRNSVHFEGWTDPEELATHYRRSETLLVPSRYEPFGIVALEAIASGCPVVAAETGGLPEAVGDCGILVAPDDAQELAHGIERALRPDVRKTLRSSMPAHVDRHRIDRIATDYLHLLRRVAQKRT
jgi:glycosyltransferase involved in cell wall biosynthesis